MHDFLPALIIMICTSDTYNQRPLEKLLVESRRIRKLSLDTSLRQRKGLVAHDDGSLVEAWVHGHTYRSIFVASTDVHLLTMVEIGLTENQGLPRR